MTKNLDKDSQPSNIAFNYKRNKAKAVLTLQGILDGVNADKKLNEIEVIYLRAWKENDIFNLNDGDFIDIHEQLEDILEDNIITKNELNDMQQMLQDILDYGTLNDVGYEGTVNHLLGFLSGISADDTLNDQEINKLSNLFKDDKELVSKWPANAIKNRLDLILADGIIDEDERIDLLNLIKAISGQSLLDTGLAYGMSADFSTTQNKQIDLTGKTICFTGKFLSGSRKFQETIASELGATAKNKFSKCIDILVLGSVASKDWRFSSYGRKIEQALEYRSNGLPIDIINEEHWNSISQ